MLRGGTDQCCQILLIKGDRVENVHWFWQCGGSLATLIRPVSCSSGAESLSKFKKEWEKIKLASTEALPVSFSVKGRTTEERCKVSRFLFYCSVGMGMMQ